MNKILDLSKRQKIAAIIAVSVLLLIVVFMVIFFAVKSFVGNNASTPLIVRNAIANHDLATFNHYVDAEELIDRAAEEILTAHINSNIDPTAYSMDELKHRYEELYPDFIASAETALKQYMSTGKITVPENPTASQKFFAKTGLDTCNIVDMAKPVTDGDKQFAKVNFYNPTLQFGFDIRFEMEQISGGEWKIISATGFDNYYKGYQRARKKKLDSLNAPIMRQIDSVFAVKDFKVEVVGTDAYGFSETLELTVDAEVKSDKPLGKVIGNVILGNGKGESKTPFTIDMTNRAQGSQSFVVNKTLNPFVRADSNAMKHGLKKSDLRIEVTEIIFADGNSIKILNELPED
ncbi:MAG: hypothetical protein K6G55_01910 [Selenomonadaceae bacterium]|nr:hypothetical protein [Selenomonadaceae bacterium]